MIIFKAISVHKIAAALAAGAAAKTGNLVLSLTGDVSFNGENNSTILDRSINALVTTAGGAGAPTTVSYSPFSSGASYFFDGFDGTGDYLTAPSSAAFAFGTGDFTIEFWLNLNSTAAPQTVYSHLDGTATLNPHIWCDTGGTIYYYTNANRITGAALATGQWYHIALCRSSGSTRLFIDGVQSGSTYSDPNNYGGGSAAPLGIGTFWSGGSPYTLSTLNGYISNVREVKGTALYTTTFTPPSSALTAIANTSLLTCHSVRLFDGSSNATNITVTGNVTASTFSPFDRTALSGSVGSTSVAFTGPSTWLQAPVNAAFRMGTGDFTVECWARRTGLSATAPILVALCGGGDLTLRWASGTTALQARYNSVTVNTASFAFPTNVWFHIAVTRSGSSSRLFVNGALVSTGTTSNDMATSAATDIGNDATGTGGFVGNISNLRIVKGTALYTAAFTPPTTALTAVSGTSLLTFDGGTIADNSSNNFSLTTLQNTGTVTVSGLNPFSDGSGWSGFFDGTGDNISTPSNAAFTFGTGDLTLECWIFQTASSSGVYRVIFGDNVYGGAGGYTLYSYNNALNLWKGGSPGAQVIAPAGTIALNTWTHVAWTRSGGSNRLFINGTQVGLTTADSTNYTSTVVYIGSSVSNTFNFTGYISNARVVKGSALYTANFTPSTSALTAVSGTSLLTLQDNTFRDNSSNAFTLTLAGDVTTRAIGPFTASTQLPSSAFFPGTSNRLFSVPASSSTNLFGGDFTIECWANIASGSTVVMPICQDNGTSSSQNFQLRIAANTLLVSFAWFTSSSSGSSTSITSTNALKRGAWNHIAVSHVRSSNTTRLFLNGALEASSTTATWAGGSVVTTIGDYNAGANQGNSFNGYITGIRLIKGRALYTAAFSVPTSLPTATPDTALLFNFNDGGLTDLYGSSGAAFTANTGVVTNVLVKKSGSGSMYFPATYMTAAQHPDYAFGTGDFTIEMWLNSTNASNSSRGIISITATAAAGVASGSNAGVGILFASSQFNGLINFHIGGTAVTGTINATNGTFTHIALCRSGSTVRLFVGGVLSVKTTSSADLTGQFLTLGATHFGGLNSPMTGYIDSLAIYKGQARYTSDTTFAPS
jgi:hypothetical protein